MRDLIPGVGKSKARKRLDELFSRKTLGAVLFGAAVSKIVEKVNILIVSVIIVYAFSINITPNMWVAALLLLMWWSLELVMFIYIYIKWEEAMSSISDAADNVKEKAEEVKSEP